MQRLRRLLAFCLVILLEGYYNHYYGGLFKCGVVAEEAAPTPTITTGYPPCWIRKGECLDNNEPPLREAIKPQINHNVIGESIGNITSVDECANECFDNPDCRYFTWYKNPLNEAETEENPCHLVGFNLKQACFNLKNRCVLLRECSQFNSSCITCQTGARPLIKPPKEPHTLILAGRTDDRNYKFTETDQYSPVETFELLRYGVETCNIPMIDFKLRIGAVADFVDDRVVICGGYSMEDQNYLAGCQKQKGRNENNEIKPWENAGSLLTARAFGSSITYEIKFNDTVMYVLGGYQINTGFLDTVEQYDKNTETFEKMDSMTMPERKSHFCTLLVEIHGLKYFYTIGGWNLDFLGSVHRIQIDTSTGEPASSATWEEVDSLIDARADHACEVIQYVHDDKNMVPTWETGILVTGGYKSIGAWTNSVEFFNFEKGIWTPFAFFPQMTEGRHYHGITTLGLIPTVFGGWNNGSLASIEQINYCSQPAPKWTETKDWLKVPREHFAAVKIPNTFFNDCSEGGEEEDE